MSVAGAGSAWAAAVVGTLFAGVSAYWALGGTWLLDTVGGSLEAAGRAGGLTVIVWSTVVLKLAAVALGLSAVARDLPMLIHRLSRIGAWVAAVILTGYGAVLTGAGLLVVSGIIAASTDADRNALRWHAFLWDPWFLLWGVLLLSALLRSRRAAAAAS